MKIYAYRVTVELKRGSSKEYLLFTMAKNDKDASRIMEEKINHRMKLANNGDDFFQKCREHYHEWENYHIDRIIDKPSNQFSHYSGKLS